MTMNCFRLRIFAPVNHRIVHYLRKRVVVRADTSRRLYRVYSSKSQLQDWHDHKWFTAEEVGDLSRRDLQRWCKKLGIRANTKTVQLRADLLEFHCDVLSSSSVLKYPFLPVQIPSKQLQGVSSPVTTLRQDKGPFVYRNADATQSNYWTNTNVCSTHGVRHYNKKCDPDEILHEDDSTAINFAVKRLPSVSGILRATAPKSRLFVISRWTKKQKELLGEVVFQQQMKEVREKGLEFHQFIHRCLVDRKLNSEAPARLQGFLESTKETFRRLGDAVVSEKIVSHPYLGYKGRVDTVACYDGNPCIIDWKTSKKKKSHLVDCGDYPLQVVAYAGAVNSDSIFGFQVKHGLIVVAYEDGSPADVHHMDLQLCRSVWQDWLVRLFKFQNQTLKAEDKHEN